MKNWRIEFQYKNDPVRGTGVITHTNKLEAMTQYGGLLKDKDIRFVRLIEVDEHDVVVHVSKNINPKTLNMIEDMVDCAIKLLPGKAGDIKKARVV